MRQTNYLNRNSFGALEDISHDMERVFDSLFGRPVGSGSKDGCKDKFSPPLDISESENAYHVSLDLPGVSPDGVKVEMHDGKLTVSGSRQGAEAQENTNKHRSERRTGEFERSVSIPTEVDIEQIEANFELGVLDVTLPKVAKPQPKQIEIRTSGK